jgi:two-component system cell cycle sensor histidine kinase/response regulator CckA
MVNKVNKLAILGSTGSIGQQALDILESPKGDGISLILLDLVMPGKDGVETFQEIKKIRPHAKAILFTGFGPEQEIKLLVHAKANGIIDEYLRKPLRIAELIAVIKKYTEDNIIIN